MYNYGANMTLQSNCDQITEKELENPCQMSPERQGKF